MLKRSNDSFLFIAFITERTTRVYLCVGGASCKLAPRFIKMDLNPHIEY
jgi:hypothetical protein